MATVDEIAALALQHHQAGRFEEAEQLYLQLLQAEPDNAEILHRYAVLAHQVGRNDVALGYARRAVTLVPLQPAFHYNRGVFAQALGQAGEAESAYREAVRLSPEHAEALNNLGMLLQAAGRAADAEGLYRKAAKVRPQYADARFNLGVLLMEQGRWADAEAALRKTIQLAPNFAPAHFRLASLLQSRGRPGEAEAAYREAIRVNPGGYEAHANLGVVLLAQGRLTEAEASYREALRLQPGSAEVLMNLGNVLQEQSRLTESQALLHEVLRLRPDFEPAVTSLLLTLNYDPASTPAQLFAEHRTRAPRVAPAPAGPVRHANDRDPDRRLRVGYVSPDLRRHPVATFLEPILARHDPAEVEAFCYAEVSVPDETTARLQALARGWRVTVGLTNEQMAAQVAADRIDVLVDLAGHTAGNRLPVLARKPAPVEVNYLGYPNTTGVPGIDYRLTDAVADPPGEPAAHSEELWRLPGCFCCFAPPAAAPAVAPLPALRAGRVTFGSLHHLAKLNEQVLDLWTRLLHSVPGSRLLLCRHSLKGELFDRFRREFEGRGLGPDRVELRSEFPAGPAGHYAVYADIDVALDVFPWGGHTTACEALWMGVPVVTLRGDRHAGRMVASVLTSAGIPDWITDSPDAYVARAAAAAADLQGLAALRAGLRERVATSPLCDAAAFTRGLEQAYRAMWRRWCAADPNAPAPAAQAPAAEQVVLHIGGPRDPEALHPWFRGPEWREVRLDADPDLQPDVTATLPDLSAVADASADAVYAPQQLVRLEAHDVPRALAELRRVLKPGGYALLSMPDLQAAALRVAEDRPEEPAYESAAGPITPLDLFYGHGASLARGLRAVAHRTGFTATSLQRALYAAGFANVHVERDGFTLWARADKGA